MKKVTISLFCELIYQLRKKRSPLDTTDISLWKAAGKKERRPAGQRSENCKKLLGAPGSHAGRVAPVTAGDRHLLCVPFGVKRPPCLEIALGAHADVLHIVFQIDGDLLALKDELPIDPAAVAGGLAPAGTDGLHLLNGVGQLQQTGGAWEALEGEV